MDWISRQFPTRVIALMPVAIAINIVLGYTVQTVLKLPIYLDSIGTILVGVLAGPLAGALTGILSNIIWQYAPGIGGGSIGPFAVTAGVIGLLAGLWGYLGVYRPRPATGTRLYGSAAIAILVIIVLAWRMYTIPAYGSSGSGSPEWVYGAIVVIGVLAAVVVGAVVLVRKDAAGAWVAVAGALTGVVAAIVSAPIAAYLFEGVTGSGTDLIVAALRQGGADVLNASLGQGLFSDPIDKTITSFVVFLVLMSLSPRLIARFPLGERTRGAYQGLSPTTKLVIAFAEAAIAFGVRGWTGPLAILVVLAITAVAAGVARRMVPFALATIPLVISILLVNTLLYPGATDVIVRLGPLAPTFSGLTAALQATLRVIAFALSAAILGLTTPTDDLLADLERRGLGRRGTFVIGSAIRMVPRMSERAAEITDSQRARGMDTEGGLSRRVRGIVPLAGPMIFGALTEVEEQTMALEARAFSAPARRTVLRTLPDSAAQRLLRWVLLLGAIAAIAAEIAGVLHLP
jgi:energy-coupling factor transport system permease protein